MAKKTSQATKLANAERARARAAEIRRTEERKQRRRNQLTVTLVAVGVIAAVVAIFAAVQATRDSTGSTAAPPDGVVDSYVFAHGPANAPVTVTVYEDFMCPYCGQFERAVGDKLDQYVEAGKVRVRYHPIAFLDRMSTTDYSTRAVNAMAVVMDQAGSKVAFKFHDLLFSHQPEENSAGLSDEQLIDLAVQAGAKQSNVAEPIKNLKYQKWVENATAAASKNGVTGTPTVKVNGERVQGQSIQQMAQNTVNAIEKALNNK